MSLSINEYRSKIDFLDKRTESESNKEAKLQMIEENISLNKEYIDLLRQPLTGYIVGCVLLSIFFFGLGLCIYLPPIIIRNNRIGICERRIAYLKQLKETL